MDGSGKDNIGASHIGVGQGTSSVVVYPDLTVVVPMLIKDNLSARLDEVGIFSDQRLFLIAVTYSHATVLDVDA